MPSLAKTRSFASRTVPAIPVTGKRRYASEAGEPSTTMDVALPTFVSGVVASIWESASAATVNVGFEVSTVQVLLAGVGSVLAAGSVALTWKVWLPSDWVP